MKDSEMTKAKASEIEKVAYMCYVIDDPKDSTSFIERLRQRTVRQRFGWCNTAYHNEWSLASAIHCALMDTAFEIEGEAGRSFIHQSGSWLARLSPFYEAPRPGEEIRTAESKMIRELADQVKNMTDEEILSGDMKRKINKIINLELFDGDTEFEVDMPLINWDPDRHYFMLDETAGGVKIVPVRVSLAGVRTDFHAKQVKLSYLVWEFQEREYHYRYIQVHPMGLCQSVEHTNGRGETRKEFRIFYAERAEAEVEAHRILHRMKKSIQKQLNELKVAA